MFSYVVFNNEVYVTLVYWCTEYLHFLNRRLTQARIQSSKMALHDRIAAKVLAALRCGCKEAALRASQCLNAARCI